MFLKQSTSQAIRIGPFLDSTDGDTEETGLTIANTDVRLSKDGGNMVAKNSGGLTHDENGWYSGTLDATDTNTVGELDVYIHVSGALAVWKRYWVIEEAIYDAFFGASAGGFDSNGRVDVGSWLGTAVTLGNGAPDVNIQSTDDIDLSATQKSSVNAECDTALTDYDAVVPADLPTNFGDLAITVTTGEVTVGTNNDKTGYSISGTKTTLDDLNDVSTAEVNAEADTALTDYDPPTKAELDAGFAALNDLSAAEVNSEVDDVLNTDAHSEPTGVPAANGSLGTKIGYLFMALRNKKTVTSTKLTIFDDAGNAEFEKDLSDDGTTYQETESNAI